MTASHILRKCRKFQHGAFSTRIRFLECFLSNRQCLARKYVILFTLVLLRPMHALNIGYLCCNHSLQFFLEVAYPRPLKVLVDAPSLASTYIILSSHPPLHQCAQAPSTGSPGCFYRTTGRFTSSWSSINSFSRWGWHLSWMFFFNSYFHTLLWWPVYDLSATKIT